MFTLTVFEILLLKNLMYLERLVAKKPLLKKPVIFQNLPRNYVIN